jgi:hypothetical protein
MGKIGGERKPIERRFRSLPLPPLNRLFYFRRHKMKYEFTGETMEYEGRTLRRVRYPKTGERGGWIESEENLSQGGEARVLGNAMVFEKARVLENAKVTEYAEVFEEAEVFGMAEVSGYSLVCGQAKVYGKAKISGSAKVFGVVDVCGTSRVSENARIIGGAAACGKDEQG